MRNVTNQGGGRVDLNLPRGGQLFARYSYTGGHKVSPLSFRGTDVPGFPTRDGYATHHATLSNTHIL